MKRLRLQLIYIKVWTYVRTKARNQQPIYIITILKVIKMELTNQMKVIQLLAG